MTVRVRQILSALNSMERTELKKLLPPAKAIKSPEEPEGTKYPAALLSALGVASPGEGYSLLGFITEDLVSLPPSAITLDRLIAVTKERCPTFTAALEDKVRKSKTNDPFLEHVRETRKKMRFAARGDFRHEETVGNAFLEGHPDFRTDTQVFEVKMTGQLAKNWQDFLYQVFAYAALAPEITDIYLVLPLQEIVWHHDVRDWPSRMAYRTFLESAITKKLTAIGPAQELTESCKIGCHMPKLKSLVDTVMGLPRDRPSQIFLCGPQSSKLNIADAELAATGQAVAATGVKLFIHSPYIINLCSPVTAENDAYHTKLLIKNLQYGSAIGARGVVVHVGKSTTQTLSEAIAVMKTNMLEAIQHATPICPILLETPAGQGSEVLRTWEEFAGFVADIHDTRLRICIDTCHVFACGHQPLDYIKKMTAIHPGFTKLIHFNDSAAPCGSCVDRHAAIGQGQIGFAVMKHIAEHAISHDVPMVIE
jgi:deoxyribonuclease-4